MQGVGFRVHGCRVQGAGCRMQGAGCKVQGAWVWGVGCMGWGVGCRVWGWGLGYRGSGFAQTAAVSHHWSLATFSHLEKRINPATHDPDHIFADDELTGP